MPSVERSELGVQARTGRGGDGRARRDAGGARTRILDAAYRLFSTHGINSVGIDRIIAEAPVAKATLYHHFASKEDLVRSFLELRERRWTVEWLQREVDRLAAMGETRLLAVFDVLDTWFHRPDFEGCAFINTLLEIGDFDSPIHQKAVRHLEVIRRLLEGYAREIDVPNATEMSYQMQLLMMGAIVSASRGDSHAAMRARGVAELLLTHSG